jgi:hypothetical protein
MDLLSGFVELSAHGVVDEISSKASRFTLVAFLLLHPRNQKDLCDDNSPENAPNNQDALESIDLHRSLLVFDPEIATTCKTYVLRSKLRVENVRSDDVSDRITRVERCVVNRLLRLSSAVPTHPRDEQRVDGVHESDEVVSDQQTALVRFRLW